MSAQITWTVARWLRPTEGLWPCASSRDGHSQGNPRLYELIEHSPKTGKSPTVWALPELIDFLKVAGQPVQGPWPPHQEPRPDPDGRVAAGGRPDPAPGGRAVRRPDPPRQPA